MVPPLHDPFPIASSPSSRRDLEARVEALTEALERLESRVNRLEGYGGAPLTTGLMPPDGIQPLEPAPEERSTLAPILGMAGQVCLILGGAFLLRTLTDAGTIPRIAGMALGLVYAATWALVAWRTPSPLRATFYALPSVLVVYPLVWESTTTFAILKPASAAAILLGAACLHIGLAWVRSLKAIAWLATLAALATAFGLMVATQSIESFVVLFLAFGVGSLWLTYGRKWHAIRWPAALAADAAVLTLTILTAWPGGPPEGYRTLSPNRTMVLALALVVIYLGSFAVRMFQRQRTLNAFEAIQTTLVLLAGFGGAVHVALASGSGAGLLGGGVLIAGLGCYGAAFPFAADREDLRANFSFFTTLALVFLLLGGPILLPRGAFALAAGVLGLAATVLGLRLRRTIPILHAAVYLTTAALASGLLAQALAAFLGSPGAGWGPPSLPAMVILGFLVTTHLLIAWEQPPEPLPWRIRVPSLLVGVQAVLGLGSLVIWAGLRSTPPGIPDAGLLAALRTGALSLAAIGLSILGRRLPSSELRWLVYPLLGVAAIKFLFEDLSVGRPLTLFLAFMVYGLALILVPRFMKAPQRPVSPGGPPGPSG